MSSFQEVPSWKCLWKWRHIATWELLEWPRDRRAKYLDFYYKLCIILNKKQENLPNTVYNIYPAIMNNWIHSKMAPRNSSFLRSWKHKDHSENVLKIATQNYINYCCLSLTLLTFYARLQLSAWIELSYKCVPMHTAKKWKKLALNTGRKTVQIMGRQEADMLVCTHLTMLTWKKCVYCINITM